ncbi:MAG: phosphoglycerate kinase [Flavobacteriales bacterium]|jgi:phosphoglycerate kinase|tara:strand:+ start:7454 stop:8644 length:1191 start_codon:yes stop_codon:yes gene_type:complete
MKTIDQVNFEGKKALIRVDFNVPLNDKFEITDDTRIAAAIPTINKVLKDGGSVILMSHLGRPKNGPEDKFSLKHIVKHLSEQLNLTVKFVNDCIGEDVSKAVNNLQNGEVLLLENLRFYTEETAGDTVFAEKLASIADVYVNDAFGTAHRAHASTAVIANFVGENKCFGYVMANEITNLEKVVNEGERPITAIMGGAKVSSKITIITKLMDKVDKIIIGGGMSYTFAKAMGGKVGDSLVEDDKLELALSLIAEAKEKGVELLIPVDSLNADAFSNDANTAVTDIDKVEDGWMGLDISDKTKTIYREAILSSKTILWNGPMGVFEMDKFAEGTKFVANAIADATAKGAFSLVGGGDSVAAVKKFNMQDKVSYVSTGGGAMLEYLEGKELPGVKAINS